MKKHEFIARGVTIDYRGGARAVRQFDLEFSGNCLAVVGGDGDGKTSLINALAGLTSYEGEFVLDGKPLDRHAGGDRVQAVLEDYCLRKNKTVYENLAFPLKIRKIPQESVEKLLSNVIREFGLSRYIDIRVSNISEAIKPYIATARLGLVDRELYLFDDILKPLQGDEKSMFSNKLREVFARLGGMKIFATSSIIEAREFADKIAVIYGGVIEQYGTFSELAANPLTVNVAKLLTKGEIEFIPAVAGEEDGRLTLTSADSTISLEKGSAERLISNAYLGRTVQFAQYDSPDGPKYLVMDYETDKTLLTALNA